MSEKKNNILIKLLAPLVTIGLFGSLCIAGLFGGSGNSLPAEEDTATEYQMIGGQMNVNWQWIMLIDMFLAQMEDRSRQKSGKTGAGTRRCVPEDGALSMAHRHGKCRVWTQGAGLKQG